MNIPKDSEGKTAGQRDREKLEKLQTRDRWVSRFILVLLGAAGAAIAFTIWTAISA